MESGILRSKSQAVGAGLDTVGASALSVAGVSSELTFEQRRELLLLESRE